MLGLVSSFSKRMPTRAASTQGETAPSIEASGRKSPKLTCPDEESHTRPTVINVDSPDQTFDAHPDLEGAPQDSLREACAPLEDGILAGGSLGAEGFVTEALL